MTAEPVTAPAPACTRSISRDRLGALALTVWFAAMLAVGATLLARHLFPLPPSPQGARVSAPAFAALRAPAEEGRWMAFHVLYATCRCSQRVAAHLLGEPRSIGVSERVLLVGRDAELERRFIVAGLRVVSVDADVLASRFGVAAAPMLVVLDPHGGLRFAGGYTDRKQSLVVHDSDVVAALRAGRAPPERPVYGCAVSAQLRAQINPLGL